MEELTLRVAYYYFGMRKDAETRHGTRFNMAYRILDMLELDGEISYDNQRKVIAFGGATFKWSFDDAKQKSSLTRLEKKMTSIPIRDIDAVMGVGNNNIQTKLAELDLEHKTGVFIDAATKKSNNTYFRYRWRNTRKRSC